MTHRPESWARSFFSGWPRGASHAAAIAALAGTLFLTGCSVWTALGGTPSGERLERMRASPQYDRDEEEFVNPLGHMRSDWGEVVWAYMTNDAVTAPDGSLPTDEALAKRLRTPAASGLRIHWIGHSTMLIEIEGKRVLTDPMFSDRASPASWVGPLRFTPPALEIDELPPLDAVLISHDHYDHLDVSSIRALGQRGVPFFVPLGVGAHLEYWGVPAAQIREMDWWDEAQVGPLTIACVPSRHFSGRGVFNRNSTLWSSWALVGEEKRAYFSGDTSLTPDFLDIGSRYGPFDIAMMESAAYNPLWPDSHMGPEQAMDAFQMVRGRLFVPIHWGTFQLALHGWTEPAERLLAAASVRGVHLVIPTPGQSVEPNSPATKERWWPSNPWKSSQESPIVSSNLPKVELPPVLLPRDP